MTWLKTAYNVKHTNTNTKKLIRNVTVINAWHFWSTNAEKCLISSLHISWFILCNLRWTAIMGLEAVLLNPATSSLKRNTQLSHNSRLFWTTYEKTEHLKTEALLPAWAGVKCMVVPVVLFSICRIPSIVKVLWKRINCCWHRRASLADFPLARKYKEEEEEGEGKQGEKAKRNHNNKLYKHDLRVRRG